MSTVAAQVHEEDHGHHHKETFMTKYIFSQDHKMIAKQYLITGLFMGIIGIAMSLLFRVQLAWPEQSFKIFGQKDDVETMSVPKTKSPSFNFCFSSKFFINLFLS